MTLPTTKTLPTTDPDRLRTFIFGRPKVGKSTFASRFPGAIFLDCEGGLRSLEVYRAPCPTWDAFLVACRDVAAGGHAFKTLVIDTIDAAYRSCSEWVLAKAGVTHESDLAYGKGSAMVRTEFLRVLNRLAHLDCGLVMISHAIDREIETRTGKRIRTVPTLPDRIAEHLLAVVDVIGFVDIVPAPDEESPALRILRTKPSPHYEAGDRTGRLPEVLPLDYGEFIKAFDRPRPAPSAKVERPVPASGTAPARARPTTAATTGRRSEA